MRDARLLGDGLQGKERHGHRLREDEKVGEDEDRGGETCRDKRDAWALEILCVESYKGYRGRRVDDQQLLYSLTVQHLGKVLPLRHRLDTDPLDRAVVEGLLQQQLPRLGVDPDTARSEANNGGVP